jgi:hypothetical protein
MLSVIDPTLHTIGPLLNMQTPPSYMDIVDAVEDHKSMWSYEDAALMKVILRFALP